MSVYTVEEFRIGNIVKQGVINEIFLNGVYRIKVRGSNVEHTTVDIDYEPLTEEWLVKLGFVEDGCSGYKLPWWRDGELVANRHINGRWSCDFENGKWLGATCLYVHELQNLYRVLTGTELTTEG